VFIEVVPWEMKYDFDCGRGSGRIKGRWITWSWKHGCCALDELVY